MRAHTYAVYLLTNRPGGTLYCGVTNDLARRLTEHRAGQAFSFTRRYNLTGLVWFEPHPAPTARIPPGGGAPILTRRANLRAARPFPSRAAQDRAGSAASVGSPVSSPDPPCRARGRIPRRAHRVLPARSFGTGNPWLSRRIRSRSDAW